MSVAASSLLSLPGMISHRENFRLLLFVFAGTLVFAGITVFAIVATYSHTFKDNYYYSTWSYEICVERVERKGFAESEIPRLCAL